jgi:hypothetical protein
VKSVKFIKRFRIYFPGDIAGFPAAEAEQLVAAGAAVYHDAELSPAVEHTAVAPPGEPATVQRRPRR